MSILYRHWDTGDRKTLQMTFIGRFIGYNSFHCILSYDRTDMVSHICHSSLFFFIIHNIVYAIVRILDRYRRWFGVGDFFRIQNQF